jgi:hypothetical protein
MTALAGLSARDRHDLSKRLDGWIVGLDNTSENLKLRKSYIGGIEP